MVRSKINPTLVFCTDGEFMSEGFYGPGHNIGVKFFKTRAAAERVRGGYKINVEKVLERI
jgi:hypothetical protein